MTSCKHRRRDPLAGMRIIKTHETAFIASLSPDFRAFLAGYLRRAVESGLQGVREAQYRQGAR